MAQDLPTHELVQFLGKLPVFERLKPDERDTLLRQCRLHALEQREVLQAKADASTRITIQHSNRRC